MVVFGSVGVSIGNAIGGQLEVINGVLGFVSGMINPILSTSINWATGIINAIPGVHIPKIPNPQYSAVAEGGIATKATLAMIMRVVSRRPLSH